jgi:hypothetical protein
MTLKSRKVIQKKNRKSKSKPDKKLKMKERTRKMKGRRRKMQGGSEKDPIKKIDTELNKIREYVKTELLKILLRGQSEEFKAEIMKKMETSDEFKKMNSKIDLVINNIEILVQSFFQTATTTSVKMATSWMPGVSIIGALITTAINWTVLCINAGNRGYDLYKIYLEMQEVIVEKGGSKTDVGGEVKKLQKEAIRAVAENQLNKTIQEGVKKTVEDLGRNARQVAAVNVPQ